MVVLVRDKLDHDFLTTIKKKAYVIDVRMERLITGDITERVTEEILVRDILRKEFLSTYGGNRAEKLIDADSAT